MSKSLKTLFKQIRRSQPFNRVSTTALKQFFEATNWRPEFAVKHLPRVGLTNITLPDGVVMKMDSSGEDWIPTQLFWRGWLGYEPEVTSVFYDLAKKADVIFDVGAHIGYFSILAARANAECRVYAFEPLKRVYERLERNVVANEIDNVQCFHTAVGDREGMQEFYFPDEQAPVSSSLRQDMLLATLGEDVVRNVTVPVVTLDSVATRLNLDSVDLIKLDTERTEHDVLAGCSEILKRYRPDIICEVWPDADNTQQLEDLLRPHDYSFYQLLREGPARRSRIQPSVDALNYLFTTKS